MEDGVLAQAAAALEALRPAFGRLDALLADALRRARELDGEGAPADAYRGLVIREEDAFAALGRAAAEPFAGGAPDGAAAASGPLAEIADAFGLATADVDLLFLALAPEIEPRYGRVMAFLQDDATRRRPTVDLALTLLASGAEHKLALRGRLVAGAPLVRTALVDLVDDPHHPDGLLPERMLRAAPSAVAAALGKAEVDAAIAGWCSLAEPPAPGPLARAALDPELVRRLTALAGEPVALVGGDDLQRDTAAAVVARAASRPLLTADLRRRRQRAPGDLVRARRDALLAGAVLHVIADEPEPPDALLPVTAEADLWDGVHLVISGDAAGEWPGTVPVQLAGDDPQRRLAVWRAALGGSVADDALGALAQRFKLSPEAIGRAATRAHGSARRRGGAGAEPTDGEAFAAARATARFGLESCARRVVVERTWDELVLPQDRLELLEALVAEVRLKRRVREDWGFARLAPAGGIAALFAGPPGTGKTMAAGLIARRLGLDLYAIDLSAVVSKYIGDTEKNLARVFDAAEASGAVLLFDEADALFGRRSAVRDAHDRYANLEIGYLLQRIEVYDGLAILATNLRQNIDPAFIRRLRVAVDFPAPDEASRRRIWEATWPVAAPAEGLDWGALASRFDVAGATIRDAALSAAYLAAADSGVVRMDHVEAAMRREYRKLGRVVEAGG